MPFRTKVFIGSVVAAIVSLVASELWLSRRVREERQAALVNHLTAEANLIAYSLQSSGAEADFDQVAHDVGRVSNSRVTLILLKCINRTIDFITRRRRSKAKCSSTARTCSKCGNVYELRRRIGMVFPLPVGLPLSVYDNVAYGPRMAGMDRDELDALVETCLRQAALWDEVKDRLDLLGTSSRAGSSSG